jgi:phage gp36-like protein
VTYATQQDLVDRFGAAELAQLTDPVAGTTIDATVVARALNDAAAEIDTRLAARYALPLASVPTVLVRVAADLARYYLWDARATEQVRNRYKDAIALLDKVGSGAVMLAGAELLTPASGAVAVAARNPAPQFSSALLDAFAPPQR